MQMSRKQLVAEIIYTTLIRGFLMLFAAFICTFFGVIGRLIAVWLVGEYVYSVVDEVKLFVEAYREAEH